VGLLRFSAVDYQTNAIGSLKMRLHAAGIVLEDKGVHSALVQGFLRHGGVNFIVEDLQDNDVF
jgi:hypothetical protein